MERIIDVKIRNKIAVPTRTVFYVCGNSDFVVMFDFDDEWTAYETKTARFKFNGTYIDQIFTGNKCPVPVISNAYSLEIGVFAGDLHTTTPAYVPAKKSILCGTGTPADPQPDVYNQLLEHINALELSTVSPEAIEKAVSDYLEENPVEGGVDFTTDATLTLDPETKVLSVNRANVAEQDNTLPITSAAVYTSIGNIEAILSTI